MLLDFGFKGVGENIHWREEMKIQRSDIDKKEMRCSTLKKMMVVRQRNMTHVSCILAA